MKIVPPDQTKPLYTPSRDVRSIRGIRELCGATTRDAQEVHQVSEGAEVLVWYRHAPGRTAKGNEQATERNGRAEAMLANEGHTNGKNGGRLIVKGAALLLDNAEWQDLYREATTPNNDEPNTEDIGTGTTTPTMMLTRYEAPPTYNDALRGCARRGCTGDALYGAALCAEHDHQRQRRTALTLALALALVAGYALHDITGRGAAQVSPSPTSTTYYQPASR